MQDKLQHMSVDELKDLLKDEAKIESLIKDERQVSLSL